MNQAPQAAIARQNTQLEDLIRRLENAVDELHEAKKKFGYNADRILGCQPEAISKDAGSIAPKQPALLNQFGNALDRFDTTLSALRAELVRFEQI